MSGRGRGRAGRGGRGALGQQGPVAKDDEGKIVALEKMEGPPPLFPDVPMPVFNASANPDAQALVPRFHGLIETAKNSVYFLGTAKDPAAVRGLGPLAGHIHLDPYYFPEELFSERDRKASARAAVAAHSALSSKDTAGVKSGLFGDKKVEEMLRRNTAKEGEAGPGAGRPDEEELPPEDLDEDDEEDLDNDYYMNEYCDDDEEYGDYDDGGGDEGPIM